MRRQTLPLLGSLVLIGACMDRELPTGPSPDAPRFSMVQSAMAPVVNATDDVVDLAGCDAAHCSLREAIAYAADGATITFDPALSGQSILLTAGQLEITGPCCVNPSLTITGPGADLLAIRRDPDAADFRIFSILQTDVQISGLTIAGGKAPVDATSAARGGGILFVRSALTLSQVTLSHNTAQLGGAIFGQSSANQLTIRHSTIENNTASSSGGGIYNVFGPLRLENSTVFGNTAGNGGGGGITLSANGPPISTILNSTIHGNSAGFGGGIYSSGSNATILNSTISGNTATSSTGGGIYHSSQGRPLWIVLTTVTGNRAALGGGGVRGTHAADENLRTQVKGSVIWGNTRLDGTADDVSNSAFLPVISHGHNLIGAAGENVDFQFHFTAPGDQTGVPSDVGVLDPELRNNGGPTETHALLRGSPAVDAATCTDREGNTVTTDQRDALRPQDGRGDGTAACDIGAFELEPPVWNFSGFLAPLRNEPEWNRANAGQTVAVKWSLGTYFGMNILAAPPTSREIACPAAGSVDGEPVPAGTAGQSALSYDQATDTYQFNWKTERSWKGKCREFILALTDEASGTHTARFDFR